MTRRTTAGSKPLMSDYFSIITFLCQFSFYSNHDFDFHPGAMTTFGVSVRFCRLSLSSKVLQAELVFQNPSYNEVEIDWDTALIKVKGQVKSLTNS